MPTRPLITDPEGRVHKKYSHRNLDSIIPTKPKGHTSVGNFHRHTKPDTPPAPRIHHPHSVQEAREDHYTPSRPEEFEFGNIHESINYDFSRYTEDSNTKYDFMPFVRQRIYNDKKQHTGFTVVLSVCTIIIGLMAGAVFGYFPPDQIQGFFSIPQEVAQAQDSAEDREFTVWARNVDPGSELNIDSRDSDTDEDGLTNYQEYLLQSNPLSPKTCDNTMSDMQALRDLIYPGTCREIDWTNPQQVSNFVEVFVESEAYTSFIDKFNPEIAQAPKVILNEEAPTSIVKPEQISAYIQEVAPGSEITGETILKYSNQHSLKPELLISTLVYGSNLGTGEEYSSNNLTRIGYTEQASYAFESSESSIATTAQLLHYLSIRDIPDCAQLAIIFAGDRQACQNIQEIYLDIEIHNYIE
jgi:hypothetical protein